jgi:hypothetical protein
MKKLNPETAYILVIIVSLLVMLFGGYMSGAFNQDRAEQDLATEWNYQFAQDSEDVDDIIILNMKKA